MKIEMDSTEIRALEFSMRNMRLDAFPKITENTINQMAREVMVEGKRQTRAIFTLRNKFTVQGVRFDTSNTPIIARQESQAGSVRGYMRVQEEGGLKRGKNGSKVNLLTPIGAGQPRGTNPRTKLALRQHRHNRLNIDDSPIRGRSQRQRNMVKIKQAASSGKGFVYLKTAKRSGIYEVYGSEKNPTVNLIWDLSRGVVRIPRTPWFAKAEQAGIDSREKHFMRSMRFQMRKHGIRF